MDGDAGAGTDVGVSLEELQLAARNHGMPLEALRWPVTPVGLHYVLVHYDIPLVDPASWHLRIDGAVDRPCSLSLADLAAFPPVTVVTTMECAGNGRAHLDPRPVSQPWLLEAVGTAAWRGARLKDVLAGVGLAGDAVELVFTGADRGVEGDVEQDYARSLTLDEADRDEVVLAYEVNGVPLPPQHGYPLRLVVPGWYGMTNVKWLRSITAVTEPFAGYYHEHSYRVRHTDDDPGTPVTRILPRSLMVPPGIPEFLSRRRIVPAGACPLEGRAWSGRAPVVAVDVSTDGGATWAPAELGDQPGPWAWRSWAFTWEPAGPGDYTLCSRARDGAGNEQPTAPGWNVGGYVNNAVQRVEVTVAAP